MKDPAGEIGQYYEDVFRYLRGLSRDEMLAEELTQETFAKALSSVDSYRGEASLRVWLCAIARNLYLTHCRQSQRYAPMGEAEALADEARHFEELIADRDAAMQIHRLLHDLEEPYKEVFMLRVFGELGFAQIGELFGKSAHWSCVTYHRAKTRLIGRMKEDAS
ncbi:MAG: sigma-70 family RNA polymerase sigma factor [Oscillospiraceae bacterium]|nr:sigma-70 family RNA polymerase sigma factor [Oscillospiraceae bacterium]